MPTRLAVLLQRRKSAAAELFHRHVKANASAGIKPGLRERGERLGRWESLGIIQRSYINWLTISRERAATVNGQTGILRHQPAKSRLFARYLRCDMANSVTVPIYQSIIPLEIPWAVPGGMTRAPPWP